MSRCYLDTNFLYVHLRTPRKDPPQPAHSWRATILEQLGADTPVTSALVLDELAYRLILAWLRDDGERDPLSAYRADATAAMRAVRDRLAKTWRAVDSLALASQPTDDEVVGRAKALMARPGLSPRDAFHAAHALAAGCSLIASTDPVFDQVRGLRRLGP
ncbi:MAG: type II toxin-antitoxin system VapC family toxin [Solirubrobacteraceae bacterium]